MICECKNMVVRIVGVERLQCKRGTFEVAPRNYCALAYRISGTTKITVNGKQYLAKANDILYVPQGVAYRAEYYDTEILVIHFETAENDEFPEVYSFDNTELIYKALCSAHILWQERRPGYEAYVMSQLYNIFGKMCETNLSDQLPEVFLQALSYINTNYSDNSLTIGRICKSSGISATNLRVFFRKHYNKTPTEYITELRLERSRNLIACGIPIEQAAEKSGFSDSKYYARVVKKHFRCTPRDLKAYGK